MYIRFVLSKTGKYLPIFMIKVLIYKNINLVLCHCQNGSNFILCTYGIFFNLLEN